MSLNWSHEHTDLQEAKMKHTSAGLFDAISVGVDRLLEHLDGDSAGANALEQGDNAGVGVPFLRHHEIMHEGGKFATNTTG